MAAFNAHCRLIKIFAKTVRYVYPLKNLRSKPKHAYLVSHAKIREIEQDLQRWMEELPMAFRPGGDAPPELVSNFYASRMALFEQLPEAVKTGRLNSVSQKKRSAPSKDSGQVKDIAASTVRTPKGFQSPASWPHLPSDAEKGYQTRPPSFFNSPVADSQSPPDLGSNYRPIPQQGFSPTTSRNMEFQSDGTTDNSMPPSTTQPGFPILSPSGNSDLNELSTMMFPSNDPFAYPNQPMTTLETLHGNSNGQPFNYNFFNSGTSSESYDNLSTPFYGPLPLYPMADHQNLPDTIEEQANSQSLLPDGNPGWNTEAAQGRYTGQPMTSNWDAMFGEDWNGCWTDQGFKQQ
ncbi:MAG: hypothetical protein Q9220_001857 [cf. Caloplaca sp. 1 TL-2023]